MSCPQKPGAAHSDGRTHLQPDLFDIARVPGRRADGLEHGGRVNFKHRAVQGAPEAAEAKILQQLLLDGQQRITSLYQTSMRRQVVETVTARRKLVRRWYYMNIKSALDSNRDREETIVGVS
jgi:hypothetical protein